jgi:ketosteroid isomerase-like protein
MSQENLAALQRLYQRWAVGDWTDGSIFDPHIVGVVPDPMPRPYYGADALADYTRSFLEAWAIARVEATEFREIENSFVVWVHLVATGSSSGLELQNRVFHVWTFRGGKAIRFEVFLQEGDALEAAGLKE